MSPKSRRTDIGIQFTMSFVALFMAATVYSIVRDFVTSQGPKIETTYFPIVTFPLKTDKIKRDRVRTCFALHPQKQRAGKPKGYFFWVQVFTGKGTGELSDLIPVAAYITDDKFHAISQEYENHDPGISWTRYYCFETPGTVSDKQAMHITGEARHDTAWVPWRTVSDIPPFEVPAIKKLSDPDDDGHLEFRPHTTPDQIPGNRYLLPNTFGSIWGFTPWASRLTLGLQNETSLRARLP